MHRRFVTGAVASVVLVPVLLALPVSTGPAASPRPVKPHAYTFALGNFDRPAAGVQLSERAGAGGPSRTLTVTRHSTAVFSAAAVSWRASGRPASVTVQVRGRAASRWTAWLTGTTDEDGPPGAGERRGGSSLLWLGPSDGIDVRVTATGAGQPPSGVQLTLIDPGRSAADAAPSGAMPRDRANADVAQPPIYTRAQWGADESQMTWPPEYDSTIKAGFVHHTVTSNDYSTGDVPAIIRSIYYYHAVTRGWGDIGYNFLVDRFGRLWQGRSGDITRPLIGAHTGGFNDYTFGIAMIGDFSQLPVPASVTSAISDVFAWKLSLYHRDPFGYTQLTSTGGGTSKYPSGTTVTKPVIMGHRDVGATECPGDDGYATLPTIRTQVARRLAVSITSSDFDGDGRSEPTVFRPSVGRWYVHGYPSSLFGQAGDIPLDGHFFGNGLTTVALFRPSTGLWAFQNQGQLLYGQSGDVPLAADFDGDGIANVAVFRPSDGTWYVRGRAPVQYGQSGDVPVPADFDGDGIADIALFRPSAGLWAFRGRASVSWGAAGDIALAADFTGDGKADVAVFRPSNGTWYIRGLSPIVYGLPGDIPVPIDADGDGKADIAVWRPSNGTWYFRGQASLVWGVAGDLPLRPGVAQ